MDNSFIIVVWSSIIVIIMGYYFKVINMRQKATNDMMLNVLKHMGLNNPIDIKLKDLVIQGEKIQAIKEAQKVYGFQLREAKDYIDSL